MILAWWDWLVKQLIEPNQMEEPATGEGRKTGGWFVGGVAGWVSKPHLANAMPASGIGSSAHIAPKAQSDERRAAQHGRRNCQDLGAYPTILAETG